MYTRKELERLANKATIASNNPKTWANFHDKHSRINVILEIPYGEMINPKISGFVLTWKMKNMITILGINESDSFNAHGLEGKASIPTSLITALLVMNEVGPYRMQVKKA